MRVSAKDLCLHQVSAIDKNVKIYVSEATKPKIKIQFQRKKI